MRSLSALATLSHSELIAVPTLRTNPVVPVMIDALRKVAGDRGLDDAADSGLELVRHFLHRGFALGGAARFIGLLFSLQFLDAQEALSSLNALAARALSPISSPRSA